MVAKGALAGVAAAALLALAAAEYGTRPEERERLRAGSNRASAAVLGRPERAPRGRRAPRRARPRIGPRCLTHRLTRARAPARAVATLQAFKAAMEARPPRLWEDPETRETYEVQKWRDALAGWTCPTPADNSFSPLITGEADAGACDPCGKTVWGNWSAPLLRLSSCLCPPPLSACRAHPASLVTGSTSRAAGRR